MIDGRCKSCRWWREQEGLGKGPGDLALRNPVTYELIEPQPFELRECHSPKVRFFERPEQDGAALLDGSEYYAVLVTGPDFGCVHFAQTEATRGH